eukprot:gene16483-22705_t
MKSRLQTLMVEYKTKLDTYMSSLGAGTMTEEEEQSCRWGLPVTGTRSAAPELNRLDGLPPWRPAPLKSQAANGNTYRHRAGCLASDQIYSISNASLAMGRRRQDKKQGKYTATEDGEGQEQHRADPRIRILALHPSTQMLALAVGPKVRMVNYGDQQKVLSPENESFPGHGSSDLRVCEFNADGSRLVTGGDDKMLRLWDTATWKCLGQWKAPKRVCAGTFTTDSKHFFFADKYGDVLVAPCDGSTDGETVSEPPVLLGHLCSILTSVTVSPDNKFIVTTDKDKKVRVSIMPPKPMLGSVEIQTYCLGHTQYVTTSAFINQTSSEAKSTLLVTDEAKSTLLVTGEAKSTLLVTGEAKSTLLVTGEAKSTLLVTDEAKSTLLAAEEATPTGDATAGGVEEGSGKAEEATPTADAAAGGGEEGGSKAEEATPTGDAAAGGGEEGSGKAEEKGAEAAGEGEEGGEGDEEEDDDGEDKEPKCPAVLIVVEGKDSVQILEVDWKSSELILRQELSLPKLRCPCHATFDKEGRLWLAGGPPIPTSTAAHVAIAAAGADGSFADCTEKLISTDLLAQLEQRVQEEEDKLASGLLQEGQMTLHLEIQNKRPYTFAELNERKKQRNDHKESIRLHGGEEKE